MEKPARKHHYIPKFMLEGFTTIGNNGRLNVFDQKTFKQWLTYPKNIAFQKDLYSIEVNESLDKNEDALEKSFAQIESLAALIIKEMEIEKELPKGEKYNTLLNFLALMHCRIPLMNELSIKPIKETFRITLDIITADESRYHSVIQRMKAEGYDVDETISFEKIKEFIESGKYSIDVNQNYKMNILLKKIDMVIPLLALRNWSLVFTDDSCGGFICSDNPFSLVSLDKLPAFLSPGLGMKNTEVSMPLSKNMLILGRFNDKEEIGYATIKTLAALNSRSTMYAERFVYSAYEDFLFIAKDGTIGNKVKLIELLRNDNDS